MTSVAEIEKLVDGYRNWQRDRTTINSVHDKWVEITTPFLDRHNDCLQIYAKSQNGGYTLSDDGNTIRDLEMSGCTIDTPRRKAILQTTINGFGVVMDNGVMSTFAQQNNFSFRKHAILQAMLAVNDLFYLSNATVRSLFKEDVTKWLEEHDIRFVPMSNSLEKADTNTFLISLSLNPKASLNVCYEQLPTRIKMQL